MTQHLFFIEKMFNSHAEKAVFSTCHLNNRNGFSKMLHSHKVAEEMFYVCFILILTSSPPSRGCCYSICLFHLTLEKTTKQQDNFYPSELKLTFASCEKTQILCSKYVFYDWMSPPFSSQGDRLFCIEFLAFNFHLHGFCNCLLPQVFQIAITCMSSQVDFTFVLINGSTPSKERKKKK